ncbi:MAG: iron-sulfur cluster assembly protein [Methanobrevibacter sp.]|uniref:metal-sulfur cluster assembly factor n=1 Tax=Methanobrevibacter sp. TaxID=66852 RepID=UPI0025D767EF|nr:iron-sulfur cluster assembly protein [Methanobrevibacter sp.]MBQ2612978.1 iron-sulfur cluster assembly protein [Methanobrevibacter sp.]MEE0025075.1 iron-sulfur cluster assembly protein [Methanobrevibacter sp.]
MSEELVNSIRDAVAVINDPHMGISIVEMGLVKDISVDGDVATITIKPTNPGCMSVTRIAADAKTLAEKVDGVSKAVIVVEGHVMADSINEMINR